MPFEFSLQHIAKTKQTACKSDSKGKLTQATFDQPSTKPDSTSTMDRPKEALTDIDLTQATQPQPANSQGQPIVNPKATAKPPAQPPAKADQGEEEVVELDVEVEGDTKAKAGPSTSTTPSTTSCKHKHDDDEDEESRRYMVQSHAAAEAWKKAVTETEDTNVAKAAYGMLYDTLFQQVLTKQPTFTVTLQIKVLDSISKPDGSHMTGDDTNVFYTEKIVEEPRKSVVNRKE